MSPEVIEKVLRDPSALHLDPPVHRPIDFVLVMVKDHDLGTVPDRLSRIADAIIESGGWREHLTGPLVIVTFGTLLAQPPDPADNARRRTQLVSRLRNELAPDIKILHGTRPALIGNFGGALVTSYGSILSGFSHLLHSLALMQFGESKEWIHDTAANENPPTELPEMS